MRNVQTVQFRVLPSPQTNDFEVRVLIDGRDLIAERWPKMMGVDPAEVLSEGVLGPREAPHRATVVRCGCGVTGCGSVSVRISPAGGGRVIWDAWEGEGGDDRALTFDGRQYRQALRSAVEDKTWESADRTAARLLEGMLGRERLAAGGFTFQWASGRVKAGAFTVSLAGPPGREQTLVHVGWRGEPPEEIARKAAETLRQGPSEWAEVDC